MPKEYAFPINAKCPGNSPFRATRERRPRILRGSIVAPNVA